MGIEGNKLGSCTRGEPVDGALDSPKTPPEEGKNKEKLVRIGTFLASR